MITSLKESLLVVLMSLGIGMGGFGDFGATICYPLDGCTGTSTAPTTNQILIGNSGGTYDVKTLTAGSNVTISNSGSAVTISSTGGGGGGGTGVGWATTTGNLLLYSTVGDQTLISATAQAATNTNAILEVWGDISADYFTASSTAVPSVFTWASTTGITATNFWGSLIGNASTATALAANGANCSAGNAPLGVDASGVVESCFDVWTEAENTSAAYIALTALSATSPILYNSSTGAFTWVGLATTSQPTSSQLLVSNGGAGVFGVSTSTLSASSPLTGSFTQIGSGGSLGIQDAAADASTKGAATFTANDFDAASGVISLDYTNGQAASASAKGFLTSTDWSLFNNKVSSSSIDTSAELKSLITDETGTGGALVFATSPTITSPTLSTFFGTPCTGQNFLQDIGDDGTFSCGAATGGGGTFSSLTDVATSSPGTGDIYYLNSSGQITNLNVGSNGQVLTLAAGLPSWAAAAGGGGDPAWATTSPYSGGLVLYPADQTNEDVVFGSNSGSTSTAPFWWDVSATTTYIGNGGTGSSTMQVGPSGYEWLFGYDGADNAFKFASSTNAIGLAVNTVFDIAKSTLLTTFNYAVTIVGNLTLTANLIIDGQSFDSFTDDATLTNNAGDLQVVDVNCTDCLGATEIEDSYLLNTTDTSSGAYTMTGLWTFSNSSTTAASFSYASSTLGDFGTAQVNGTLYTDFIDAYSGGSPLTLQSNILVNGGLLDVGGGVLEIPNGTGPTIDAVGELAWDTTSGQMKIHDGTATRVLSNGYLYPAFTYSTSTAWAGTTTIPLGPSFVAETWSQVMCFTDAGTVNVSFYDGTNRMNLFNASTTVGVVTLSTNNTFTAAEKRYVDVGTPASSPTKVSCTLRKSITAD